MSLDQPAGLTRRSFLLGALLPLAGRLPVPGQVDPRRGDLGTWLNAQFPDTPATAAIGSHYLSGRPAERSATWLARTLFQCDPSSPLDRREFERLLRQLAVSRDRDFRDDDLVIIDGWLVTRTEARLMALVTLCVPR